MASRAKSSRGPRPPRLSSGASVGAVQRAPVGLPRPDSPPGWVSPTALLWSVALVALLVPFVVYLAHVAVILPYPFDLDQGEGYDVNAGRLVLRGRPIYTDNEQYPYFSSNYPPLYSAAVAGAILVWGPSPLAGRVVSLAATLALAGLIYLAARERSNPLGGLVATGLFWTSNYVFHVTPLARVNALAALLAFGGLVCLTRPGRGWLAAAVGLLLAALFTKPTAIDAAAAGLGYLALTRPRAALGAGLALGGVGLVLVGALELLTAGAFSLNVLFGNVNPFSPDQLRAYLVNFGLLHGVPLALSVAALVLAARARRPDPVHFFLLTGGLMALGVGKWGAGESYFLSAIVASSVLAGAMAGSLFARGGMLAGVVPVLVVVQTLVSAHGAVSARLPGLPDRGLQAADLGSEPSRADLERGYGIVTRLQARDGPGLLEDPSFGLAAGKEVVGNATQLRNLHAAGLWRGEALVAEVVAKRYHTVVLDAELYPEPLLAAIGQHYFLYETVPVYRATQQVFLPGAD